MLLVCVKTFGATKIHFLAAVSTVNHSRKRIDFFLMLKLSLVFAKLLHQIIIFLWNYCLVRVFKDCPILFGIINLFLALVGFCSGSEINRVTHIFKLFKQIRYRSLCPAIRFDTSNVSRFLQFNICGRRKNFILSQYSRNLRRTISVNAKLKYSADNLCGFLVNLPYIFVRFWLFVAVRRNCSERLSRQTLSLENCLNLLWAVTGIVNNSSFVFRW